MKSRAKTGIGPWVGVAALMFCSGCMQSGRGLAALNPWRQQSQDAALADMMSSQQQSARKSKSGNQTSLYPPQIVQNEPLPRTESDLKNPMDLHLSYAKLQEQLGHLTEARSSYEKVISREPKSVEAIIGLGRIDALAGRHPQAEQRFRHAVDVSKGSAEAVYALGQYMASQKRYTEAIVEMQKAANLVPKNSQYRYELGLTLARAGQFEEAQRTLDTVGTPAESCYNIGYIAMKELGRNDVAEKYLQRSIELDPELRESRYWLTQLKSGDSRVATVSGQAAADGTSVVNAGLTRHLSEPDPGRVVPADQNSPVPPAGLTPEQWEQWKNQVHPQ